MAGNKPNKGNPNYRKGRPISTKGSGYKTQGPAKNSGRKVGGPGNR